MTQTIQVSKQNKDVLTITDPNDFIFKSSLNTFKIISSDTVSGTVNTDPYTITLAHSQSGVPGFYAFCKFPDGYVAMPQEYEYSSYRWWYVEADSTNLYFVFKNYGTVFTPVVRYYIFETPL